MKRRQFIAGAGAAAATWPLGTRAQQSDQVRRVGLLISRTEGDPEGERQVAAFRQGLRDLGWRLGQSLQIDYRWTAGSSAKALEYAPELVALRPSVLVANGTPSLVAARQVAGTIPIVFVGVADPVRQGFVPNLARPGGNVTGFSVEEASMGGKWLEYLKEIAPRLNHVVIIANPDTAPYATMFMPSMQAAAQAKGITLMSSEVRNATEIEEALAKAAEKPDGGLVVLPDSYLFSSRAPIIATAARLRLPAIYPLGRFASEGGLIAYGIDRFDLFRRAAGYVDRILKGELAGELPVQLPTKFELIVSLKTAKALNLTVPQSLLLSADEVIE
jgi:putative tryptophan/tyrosine transport system substrate-binding protein